MDQFRTIRDAKEYLIRQILEQADRDGVSLSDVERKMLYFSETGWTLPNMMEISREFDQGYDQDEYERKIARIIKRIHEMRSPESADRWEKAVHKLRDEDHYLLVLIDADSNGTIKMSRWEFMRLFLAGGVVVVIFLPISFFIYSHVDNPAIAKLITVSLLVGLTVLVTFFANRGRGRSA